MASEMTTLLMVVEREMAKFGANRGPRQGLKALVNGPRPRGRQGEGAGWERPVTTLTSNDLRDGLAAVVCAQQASGFAVSG